MSSIEGWKILSEIDIKMSKIKMSLQEKLNFAPRTAISEIEDIQRKLDDILKMEDIQKGPKNWNDLPNSIKLMCIEKMSFMTKIHVAKTSRTEKAPVDSVKPITWNTVTLKIIGGFPTGFLIVFVAKSKKLKITKKACLADISIEGSVTRELSQLVDAFLYVFKKGNVQHFGVSENDLYSDPPHLLKLLGKHAPYKLNNFWMEGGHSCISTLFIKNFERPLDKLHIVGEITAMEIKQFSPGNPFGEEFADMVRTFKMGASRQLQYMVKSYNQHVLWCILGDFLHYWIRNDSSIGTRLITFRTFSWNVCFADYWKAVFMELIANSSFLIRKDGEDIPINTTKTKAILIREELVDENVYTTCVIIPTTLRPSEYENAQDWFWRVPAI